MASIPSILRIPAAEFGQAVDQSAATAFLAAQQPDGFGLFTDMGAFAVYYRAQATTSLRLFRSPHVHDETARWQTVPEFKPLAPVKPVKHPIWFLQFLNDIPAARATALADCSRYVSLPWNPTWKRPPAANPQMADFGVLIDDDASGLSGWEILGLRQVTIFDVAAINFRAGAPVSREGDWICDFLCYRTPENSGDHIARGAGKPVDKRAGLIFPDDLTNGWDEAKALVLPNVAWGRGATCSPGFRVEHPNKFKEGNQPGVTIPHGTLFYSTRSRAQIERWADDEGFTGPLRRSAINCGVGLSQFGMRCLETGGIAGLESVGINFNPDHREGFKRAGITTTPIGWRILHGFWDRATMRAAADAPIGVRR